MVYVADLACARQGNQGDYDDLEDTSSAPRVQHAMFLQHLPCEIPRQCWLVVLGYLVPVNLGQESAGCCAQGEVLSLCRGQGSTCYGFVLNDFSEANRC